MRMTPDGNGTVTLSGDLTLETVGPIYRTNPQLDGSVKRIALAGLGRVDSAGLALLLEWQSAAVAQGRRLAFDEAPNDLVRLAALCEADDLLGIARAPTPNGDDHESD